MLDCRGKEAEPFLKRSFSLITFSHHFNHGNEIQSEARVFYCPVCVLCRITLSLEDKKLRKGNTLAFIIRPTMRNDDYR
jgi:hypothetical protein